LTRGSLEKPLFSLFVAVSCSQGKAAKAARRPGGQATRRPGGQVTRAQAHASKHVRTHARTHPFFFCCEWIEQALDPWVVRGRARLMKRNGFGEEEADKRLASQPMTDAERAARAAVVLSNEGTEEQLIAKASAKDFCALVWTSERIAPRRLCSGAQSRIRVVSGWSQATFTPHSERPQLRLMWFSVSL